MTAANDPFPHVDASRQDCITDEQARFFLDNGLLVVRNVLRGEELKRLQDETLPMIERIAKEDSADPWKPDYLYGYHVPLQKRVPMRVEYVIDKTASCKVLLAHPFILRSVEKLQGRNFVPTWDSMVFKYPGMGAGVPWHRDSGANLTSGRPIFNVDFYLDASDATNCLWGIPGSTLWPDDMVTATLERLNKGGFNTDGAVQILMNPGDVIFHDIRALHGSPPAQSRLRRVLYFEFRPAEIELENGPHNAEYIPLKQRVLLSCLRRRATAPYAKGETPFVYNPAKEFAAPPLGVAEELATYRYPHEKYWRKAT